jgi:hypothetical protein
VAWYIQNSQCHVCRWQENKVIMANGLVACCLHAPMDPSPTCIDDTLDLAASLKYAGGRRRCWTIVEGGVSASGRSRLSIPPTSRKACCGCACHRCLPPPLTPLLPAFSIAGGRSGTAALDATRMPLYADIPDSISPSQSLSVLCMSSCSLPPTARPTPVQVQRPLQGVDIFHPLPLPSSIRCIQRRQTSVSAVA